MAKKTQSVRELMCSSNALKMLADEAGAQQTLLGELRQRLPGALADHCSAARLQDRQLVVFVDSPAWATRLRFLAPQLPDSLHQLYPALETVRVKVAITQHGPVHPRRQARHSAVGASIIHECAVDTSDPPLREALLRLSRVLNSS